MQNDDSGERVAIPEDGHGPIPPRYWWLKRISIGVGVLLVALVVLRLWWGWEADRRLQAEIDRIIASGEPFYPEDYIEDIPDEQNAAVLYDEAVKLFDASVSPAAEINFVCSDFLSCPEMLEDARRAVEDRRAILRILRRARSRSEVFWKNVGMRFATVGVVDLGTQRKLSKLMHMSAFCDFHDANHEELVATFHDMIAQADALSCRPHLIDSLVALACKSMARHALQATVAKLVVSDAGVQPSGTQPARRRQVMELMSRLLNEEPMRSSIVRSFHGERTLAYDSVQWMAGTGTGSTGWPGVSVVELIDNLLARPLYSLDSVRLMRGFSVFALAAQEDSWPAAAGRIASETSQATTVRAVSRPMTEPPYGSVYTSHVRSLQLYFRTVAENRLAATAIAIRLYELDYGERPDSLEVLVPDYLPSVPADPFTDDQSSIRYTRDSGGDRLYSVGLNGRDDGGDDTREKPFRSRDYVFFLDGKPVENEEGKYDDASSGEAVNDNQHGEDDRENAGNEDDREHQPK
ncbi:MAG: hypothetical protein IH987_00100 [Planctomycetes bacterium]|nr:hypothetical protein [Planctomycetota bacterium]